MALDLGSKEKIQARRAYFAIARRLREAEVGSSLKIGRHICWGTYPIKNSDVPHPPYLDTCTRNN
jgi:hypothetical protein